MEPEELRISFTNRIWDVYETIREVFGTINENILRSFCSLET